MQIGFLVTGEVKITRQFMLVCCYYTIFSMDDTDLYLHHVIVEFSEFNAQKSWNSTWTDKLKRDLLTNYDKFSRPVEHYNQTIVTVGINVRHIEFDANKPVFTVYGWFQMVKL